MGNVNECDEKMEDLLNEYKNKLFENKEYILYLESMIKSSLDIQENVKSLGNSEELNLKKMIKSLQKELLTLHNENKVLQNEVLKLRNENKRLQKELSSR